MGTLRDLFLTFAKMGAITFGGGMAMLPILQREVVYTRHWVTEEELIDYYAIGQCTPGIIAINTSTFIGQKQAGIFGGIVATLGMVFPSLVFISIIAGLISNFADIPAVRNAFAGIQVCVCVLIFNATMKLLKKSVIDYRTAVIFALVLAGSVLLNLSPVWFVLLSAVTGAALKALEARYAAKRAESDTPAAQSVTSAAQAETQAVTPNEDSGDETQSGADGVSEPDTDGENDAQADNHGDGAETERDKT
ncbi:MAG: chromate transporter [Oscillibacter sp.]|nr:chromate transporter [Oscillibacter sp.]